MSLYTHALILCNRLFYCSWILLYVSESQPPFQAPPRGWGAVRKGGVRFILLVACLANAIPRASA